MLLRLTSVLDFTDVQQGLVAHLVIPVTGQSIEGPTVLVKAGAIVRCTRCPAGVGRRFAFRAPAPITLISNVIQGFKRENY